MSKRDDYTKIKESYFTLVSDEIEFGIVTALNWYESLNLKKLAIMINKPESTTLRYIRRLKDEGLIVFDSKKSEDSWGKYYKLSTKTKKIYDTYMQAMDKQIESVADDLGDLSKFTEEELEKYVIGQLLTDEKIREIPLLRHYFHFVSNLQNVMMNEAVNTIDEFTQTFYSEKNDTILNKVKVSPIDISLYVNHLKISKWSHIFRINKLIFEFIKKLDDLKKSIAKEMDEENVPEDQQSTQLVNIFTGNLDVSYEIIE